MPKESTVVIKIRVPTSQVEIMKKQAQEAEQTLAGRIRLAINQFLKGALK